MGKKETATADASRKEVLAQAEAFAAKPRAWRKSAEGVATFAELSGAAQRKAREIIESRRGFRRVNGVVEFSKEALAEQITRLKTKREDMEARLPLIDARIEELEDEFAERFGGDNE